MQLELTVLLALLPAAPNTTLFVDSATSSADLMELLGDELSPLVFTNTSTAADLIAHLSQQNRLRVRDRTNAVLVDRALEGTRDAAVRVAALLIVETMTVYERPVPVGEIEATMAPLQIEHTWVLAVAVGGGLSWWSEPTPRGVLRVATHLALGDWSAGLAGEVQLGSVDQGNVAASGWGGSFLVEGRYRFFSPVDIELAGGLERETLDFQARFAGGEGKKESRPITGVIGRIGLGLSLPRGPIRGRLGAALQLQSPFSVTTPVEGVTFERSILAVRIVLEISNDFDLL